MSFDDLLIELKEQKANQAELEQSSLAHLFNESFMSKNSNCKSMQEFLDRGNFQAYTKEDMNLIPEELLNRHVARETRFSDWKSMLDAAMSEQPIA
ncbi:hypothetical protein DX130_22130 [Paenibacillus paeoniae]|uniref:Uncharacterized protein n=2 Tax=Paenibacillus paeoniae TaxID=2292705 RepID=A0A371P5C7_9BACL|nr:hypothetical protein [Paenibacillus paeoniae]REK71154.1 hypothetical protein DX130_22130 [Paenibacillus paeoniae]